MIDEFEQLKSPVEEAIENVGDKIDAIDNGILVDIKENTERLGRAVEFLLGIIAVILFLIYLKIN